MKDINILKGKICKEVERYIYYIIYVMAWDCKSLRIGFFWCVAINEFSVQFHFGSRIMWWWVVFFVLDVCSLINSIIEQLSSSFCSPLGFVNGGRFCSVWSCSVRLCFSLCAKLCSLSLWFHSGVTHMLNLVHHGFDAFAWSVQPLSFSASVTLCPCPVSLLSFPLIV